MKSKKIESRHAIGDIVKFTGFSTINRGEHEGVVLAVEQVKTYVDREEIKYQIQPSDPEKFGFDGVISRYECDLVRIP